MLTNISNHPGVYKIINTINNYSYIGSSITIRARLTRHFWDLSQNCHHSQHLQNAYNKYGKSSFIVEILISCAKEDRLLYEQQYIDKLKPEYNSCPTAFSCSGIKLSSEQIAKRSGSNSCKYGKPMPQEVKDKISAALKGRKLPQEVIEKMSASHIGKKATKETCQRISEARKTIIFSEKHKQNLSISSKNMTPEKRAKIVEAQQSLEARAKISARFKGIPLSEECKKKLSLINTGKKQSPETIAKRIATKKKNKEAKEAGLLASLASL